MSRPESYYDNNAGNNYGNGYYPTRARYPRTAGESNFNNGRDIYTANENHQQLYDTVNSASGSGSSGEPLGYSTDPSSENSSVDRIQSAPKPEFAEINGFSGFGPAPNVQIPNYGSNGPGGYTEKQPEVPVMNRGYGGRNPGPPPVPPKHSQAPLAGSSPNTNGTARPGAGEKRKSWFGKRFSKS